MGVPASRLETIRDLTDAWTSQLRSDEVRLTVSASDSLFRFSARFEAVLLDWSNGSGLSRPPLLLAAGRLQPVLCHAVAARRAAGVSLGKFARLLRRAL